MASQVWSLLSISYTKNLLFQFFNIGNFLCCFSSKGALSLWSPLFPLRLNVTKQ
jgi:hypothetical protein